MEYREDLYPIEDVVKELERATHLFFRQTETELSGRTASFLNAYRQLVEEYVEETLNLVDKANGPAELWRRIDEHVEEVEELLADFVPVDPTIRGGALIARWDQAFSTMTSALPSRLRLEIPDEFWKITPQDSLLFRFWKRRTYFNLSLQRRFRGIDNLLRRLFRLEELPPIVAYRMVPFRSFLRFYYALPVADELVTLWARHLRSFAEEISFLHEELEVCQDAQMFFDTFSETLCTLTPAMREQVRTALARYRVEVSRFAERGRVGLDAQATARQELLDAAGRRVFALFPDAATPGAPVRRFSDTAYLRGRQALPASFERAGVAWEEHFRGEFDEWKKDLEIARLQVNVALLAHDMTEILTRRVEEKILPPLRETGVVIEEAIESLAAIERTVDGTEAKRRLTLEAHRLERTICQERVPALIDVFSSSNLAGLCDGFIERVQERMSDLSAAHSFFIVRDAERLIPQSKVEDISLSELIGTGFLKKAEQRRRETLTPLRAHQEQIIVRLGDVDSIVSSTIEAVQTLLRKQTETLDPQAVREERAGLDRVKAVIGEIGAGIEALKKEIAAVLSSFAAEIENDTEEYSNPDHLYQLRLALMRTRTSREIKRRLRQVWDRTKIAFGMVATFSKERRDVFRKRFTQIRQMTGMTKRADSTGFGFTQYLNQAIKRVQKLPYIYQRLFRNDPLVDGEFMFGRDQLLAMMRADFSLWSEGAVVSTLLVGEKGSGKTTLLNVFGDHLRKKKAMITRIEPKERAVTVDALEKLLVAHLGRPDAQTLAAIEETIEDQPPRVCMLEDLHYFFLRIVDGFAAMERLLLFIARTQRRIYWIVNCNLYTARYLDASVRLTSSFQRIIRLDSPGREVLERIILKRHAASGYAIEYKPSEGMLNNRRYRRLDSDDERQEVVREQYFEDLARISQGNIGVALLLWLNSVRHEAQDRIVVYSNLVANYPFINQLSPEDLFSLAAIVQHNELTAQEHARIFHAAVEESSLALNRLQNNGLLLKTGEAFRIHPFIYRPVIRTLSASKILHGGGKLS